MPPTDKNHALVPVLRFPEYQNNGGWDEDKLSELVSTVTPPKKLPTNLYQDVGQYPIIDQSQSNICGWTNDKESLISDNFPLIIFGDHTCILKIAREPFAQGADGIKILKAKDRVEPEFLYQALQVRPVVMEEYKRHFSILRERIVGFPEKEFGEQQKIADCLTSVDELITAQTQKLVALKTHKKGLMQQLFPAEGETVPKLRFPEFRDKGEWRAEELGGKTKKVGSGITPTGGDQNYKTEGRPFVRSQNIGWGCLLLDNVAYIDDETHSSFSATEIQIDDVLLNITGASIGRSAIANYQIEGGNVNQHVCIIRTKKKELDPFFLNQFLISQAGQSQIDSFQAGGNRQGLNFAQIRSFTIPMPPKVEEQQKIADCLTSIDELITAQTQKVGALKTHKKGLMQQLFPAMDDDCMDAGGTSPRMDEGRATQDAKAEVSA